MEKRRSQELLAIPKLEGELKEKQDELQELNQQLQSLRGEVKTLEEAREAAANTLQKAAAESESSSQLLQSLKVLLIPL